MAKDTGRRQQAEGDRETEGEAEARGEVAGGELAECSRANPNGDGGGLTLHPLHCQVSVRLQEQEPSQVSTSTHPSTFLAICSLAAGMLKDYL